MLAFTLRPKLSARGGGTKTLRPLQGYVELRPLALLITLGDGFRLLIALGDGLRLLHRRGGNFLSTGAIRLLVWLLSDSALPNGRGNGGTRRLRGDGASRIICCCCCLGSTTALLRWPQPTPWNRKAILTSHVPFGNVLCGTCTHLNSSYCTCKVDRSSNDGQANSTCTSCAAGSWHQGSQEICQPSPVAFTTGCCGGGGK
mmetsp:Transcript_38988/g.61724  ORF Transcript_38988/g.61724 Transcript_38988/m.61724 type:complete len:201 (-) Transcript_38988:905-1507(-)